MRNINFTLGLLLALLAATGCATHSPSPVETEFTEPSPLTKHLLGDPDSEAFKAAFNQCQIEIEARSFRMPTALLYEFGVEFSRPVAIRVEHGTATASNFFSGVTGPSTVSRFFNFHRSGSDPFSTDGILTSILTSPESQMVLAEMNRRKIPVSVSPPFLIASGETNPVTICRDDTCRVSGSLARDCYTIDLNIQMPQKITNVQVTVWDDHVYTIATASGTQTCLTMLRSRIVDQQRRRVNGPNNAVRREGLPWP